MIYDAVIIGTGPAALSAALNLKIHEKTFVCFGSRSMSDKVRKAEKIFNYPGLPQITGEELADRFCEHAKQMEIEIVEKMVTNIFPFEDRYFVTAQDDLYETKTVLMATGVVNTKGFPGETELLGRGVSCCATCDGRLYQGKTIAVVSNSARFEHEVQYLAELASKVYFFPMYAKHQVEASNVEWVKSGIEEITGQQRVSGLKLKNGEMLEVDGVFCLRNAIAPTTLLPTLEVEGGHILVNRQMETNLSGVYAAGDCTGRPYQYVKAAGEGNTAAHAMISYLAEH